MNGVADQAVFRHRRMLVSKRPAILRMAAQAELIHVRRQKIVPRRPAMRIMTILTAHLAFAQRVMIRHAELGTLALVTLDASVVGLGPGPQYHVGLRRHRARNESSLSRRIEAGPALGCSRWCVVMALVTIDAANMIC